MKRNTKIFIASFLIIMTLLLSTFFIDNYRMKNNLPVIFSTWGKKYAPALPNPEPYTTYTVINRTEICADALESIGSDEKYDYYLPCIQSETIFIKYDNGSEETLKMALDKGHITIESLLTHNINIIKNEKQNIEEEFAYLISSKSIYSLNDERISFTIENKTNKALYTLAIPTLEFKTDLGWKQLEFNNTAGFCGNKDSINKSIELILLLSWYDNLKAGNYRISFNIYNEMEKKLYSVSKEFSLEN